jgi:heat shock protein HslJ
MIPRTALTLLVASALAVAAACGSDDDSSSSGAAPTADDLAGSTFESTEVSGHDLVADSTITLAFEADTLSASAGCNTMNGGYTIEDGDLEVSALAMTMMACEDSLMEQDTWLSEFLGSGPTIALDGETLTLSADDTTMTLVAQAPADVEGTTWVVTGIVANEAVSSVPAGTEGAATLTITDGQAAIETGCNTGSGTVEVTDTTMTFGPVALTRKACEPEVTELEASVVLVLDGEVAYEVDGDTLSMRKTGADGEIGLQFAAQ